MLAAAVMWTILMPLNLIAPAIDVVKKFADKTRGQSKHKHGHPHVQAWNQVLTTLMTAIKSLPLETQASLHAEMTAVEKMHKEYQAAGPTKAALFIRICKVKETRDNMGLLTYTLSHLNIDVADMDLCLHKLFSALEGDVRMGTAPPSELERAIQRDIDTLSAQLGKKKTR